MLQFLFDCLEVVLARLGKIEQGPSPAIANVVVAMLNPNPPRRPLFSLGRIVATPGAIAALEKSGESLAKFFARHILGDWGDVCDEDGNAKRSALTNGDRLVSAYRTQLNEKIWIITEADRSSTCLLLPEEY